MSMEERHILLRERKALAARLVQIEAVLPLKEKFGRSVANLAYKRLDEKPRDIFEQLETELKSDQIQLDDFLTPFLNQLQYFARGDLHGKLHLISELEEALQTRAGDMCCRTCTRFPPSICNGSDEDDKIVNAGAACLAPLQEMLDIACDIARHYYVTHGTLMSGNPEVILGTENFSQRKNNPDDRPHDLPIRYFVNAETKYFDEPGQRRAQVILKMPVRAFDSNTYLSTLYILFHECIAHTFRAITCTATPRSGTKDEDRFLEGWMDWISFKILERILNGNGRSALLRNLKFLLDRLDRADRFHQARVAVETPASSEPPSQFASDRATGRRAAMKVLKLFENRPEECPRPWEKFLQMSFDLNMMSSFDEKQRQSFVGVLDYLNEDDTALDVSDEHYELAMLLTKYLVDNNLQALIDSVVALHAQWVDSI